MRGAEGREMRNSTMGHICWLSRPNRQIEKDGAKGQGTGLQYSPRRFSFSFTWVRKGLDIDFVLPPRLFETAALPAAGALQSMSHCWSVGIRWACEL